MTTTRERPILMAGRLVRATLEGRKTQTRRPLRIPAGYIMGEERGDGMPWPFYQAHDFFGGEDPWLPCPFGKPGDVLWVRETFAWRLNEDREAPVEPEQFIYRATPPPDLDECRWTPSIHMPRRACRLRLRITDVRVERVASISEEDAEAEGCAGTPSGRHPSGDDGQSPREEFRAVWDSLYPGTWDTAWCWAIIYEVLP